MIDLLKDARAEIAACWEGCRSAASRRSSGARHIITFWAPRDFLASLDEAVRLEDSDRSKFIRRALRERLKTIGIPVTEEAA